MIWYPLMCLGRMYVGSHSPHDIIFGTLLGWTYLNLIDENTSEALVVKIKSWTHPLVSAGIIVFMGTMFAFFWADLTRYWNEDAHQIAKWDSLCAAAGCSQLHLFTAREAFASMGSLVGFLLHRMLDPNVEFASGPRRFWAVLIFLFSKWISEQGQKDFPPETAPVFLFAGGIAAGIATWLLFAPPQLTVLGTTMSPKRVTMNKATYGAMTHL